MRGRIIGVFEQEYCNYESKYLILNGLVSTSDVFLRQNPPRNALIYPSTTPLLQTQGSSHTQGCRSKQYKGRLESEIVGKKHGL